MNDEVNIRLLIDPTTKKIAPKYRTQKAVYVAKGDRNSVRINFEMPSNVDGFDMSEEDTFIHIHYVNTDGENVSKGVSEAIDVVEEGDNIVFSWLVPNTATRYAGVLSIGVTFERYDTVDDKAQEVYSWSTAPYGKVIVWDSLDNTGEFAEEEYDKLVNTCNTLVELALNSKITEAEKNIDEKVAKVIKQLDDKADEVSKQLEAEVYKAELGALSSKSNATLSKSYAVGGTGSRDGEDWDNAKYYKEDAKQMNLEATESAFIAESYAHGGTGARENEDTDNALYYMEEAKKYADASYRMKGEVNGTGAVRLDFIADRSPNLVVNTTDVKSFGKNLADFKKGTSSAPFSLGYATQPMVVTAIITTPSGTVGVQQKDASGNWSYISPRFYASSKYTPSLKLEAGFEYRVNGTDAGFSSIDKLQLELGDKATAYEEYKGYSIGVVPYFPTTTLIADNPEAEINATYNKDIGLVVADLEDKIASLENAIANN